MSKDINNITLFKYLYELDNRDLPNSIIRCFENIHSCVDEDRKCAIKELESIKGKCRNLVKFSKTFVDCIDKSYLKFTQFHIDILKECEGECGIVKSPYFIDDSYVVYKVNNGCLTLWVFQENIDKYISIPTHYIVITPKDKIKGNGHQIDRMTLPLCDYIYEPIEFLQDYHDMVLDYLCLRQWAEVEIAEVKTRIKKKIKKQNKTLEITDDGLSYFTFDSKWYTEICNNNDILVNGHFRHQNYADGTRKLIWINEFTRHGYHRKALIDKYKDGELILE